MGVALAGVVKKLRSAVYEGATACDNCRHTAVRACIGLDGVVAAGPMSGVLAGNGPPAAPVALASLSSDEESKIRRGLIESGGSPLRPESCSTTLSVPNV